MSLPDHITDIKVSVARIEEGITNLTKSIDGAVVPRLNDHAKDIKSLNLSRSRAKGIVATLVGMASSVGVILGLYD